MDHFKHFSPRTWILLLVSFAVLGLISIYFVFAIQIELLPTVVDEYTARRVQAEQQIWGTAVRIGTGVAVLIGFALTAWRVSVSDRQVKVTEQGQITERFTRAIDHLGARNQDGSPNLEARLGGIYALERIAKDSQQDHPVVMEVLTDYLHERVPWYNPVELFLGDLTDPDQRLEQQDYALDLGDPENEESQQPPPTDVQAVLRVIGRRSHIETELVPHRIFQANLANAQLWHGEFGSVRFDECNLRRSGWGRCNLRGALFDGCVLRKAAFFKCDLTGASFLQAHLGGTTFTASVMDSVMVRRAHLTKMKDLTGDQIKGLSIAPVEELQELLRDAQPEDLE